MCECCQNEVFRLWVRFSLTFCSAKKNSASLSRANYFYRLNELAGTVYISSLISFFFTSLYTAARLLIPSPTPPFILGGKKTKSPRRVT